MNRTIKFRVWDKNRKIFLDYPCYFNHLDFNEFTCFDRYFKCDEDDCVVQQFTGLLDKNGKEIYEGDFIQAMAGGETFYGLIGWNNYSSGFKVKELTKTPYPGDSRWNLEYMSCNIAEGQIIGNIFENPELLK